MFSASITPDPDSLKACIASDFGQSDQLYNGLVFEVCDAFSSIATTTIAAPGPLVQSPLRRGLSGAKQIISGVPMASCSAEQIPQGFDLFMFVCMRPDSLVALKAMNGWNKSAPIKAAYLFETWSQQARKYRHYLQILDGFDFVFLFNPNSVDEIQKYTSAKCVYMPAAVDCLRATPYPDPVARPIDVYGMGRTREDVHECLLSLTRENRLFYLWDRGPGRASTGFPQARLRTYHMIRHSRMFTSFNFRAGGAKLEESGGEEAIPARVFEGAAAGAALIGSAPNLPQFQELFDWPDALIELPAEAAELKSFLLELQSDQSRIHRAGVTNAVQSLRRHDWVYRWEAILNLMQLPVPKAVEERKQQLSSLADLAASLHLVSSGHSASFGEMTETGRGQAIASPGSS